MIGDTDNGRGSVSVSFLRRRCALVLVILLLAMAACGASNPPETPSNQRYWYDVDGMVVLHWDPSANASSYAVHLVDRDCPWSTTIVESEPCILQRESGEYWLIKCPELEENQCTILRESGENERLDCSEFARLGCSILVQQRSPREIGETGSTTASVLVTSVLVGESVAGCTSANPAVFVTACNL